MSEDAKDTRSAEDIESDLARTRAELSSTVNELTEMLDPRRQVENAKNNLREAAARAGDSAKEAAAGAKVQAKAFLAEVKDGDPKSVGALSAGVAITLAAFAILTRRGR